MFLHIECLYIIICIKILVKRDLFYFFNFIIMSIYVCLLLCFFNRLELLAVYCSMIKKFILLHSNSGGNIHLSVCICMFMHTRACIYHVYKMQLTQACVDVLFLLVFRFV